MLTFLTLLILQSTQFLITPSVETPQFVAKISQHQILLPDVALASVNPLLHIIKPSAFNVYSSSSWRCRKVTDKPGIDPNMESH